MPNLEPDDLERVNPTRRKILAFIHSTKISGIFGLKLNGSLRSKRKSFEKIGPPFEVNQFSRLDWSDRNSILPFRPTLNPRTLLFGKDALIPFFFQTDAIPSTYWLFSSISIPIPILWRHWVNWKVTWSGWPSTKLSHTVNGRYCSVLSCWINNTDKQVKDFSLLNGFWYWVASWNIKKEIIYDNCWQQNMLNLVLL